MCEYITVLRHNSTQGIIKCGYSMEKKKSFNDVLGVTGSQPVNRKRKKKTTRMSRKTWKHVREVQGDEKLPPQTRLDGAEHLCRPAGQ